MGRVRLVPGVKFRFEHSTWEITRLLPGRRLLARNLTFGHDNTFDWIEIIKHCLVDGSLLLETKGRAARMELDQEMTVEYEWADFSQVPEPARTSAWVRYQIIRPLLSIPQGHRKQHVKSRLQEIQSKSILETLLPPDYNGDRLFIPTKRWQTLYEWLDAFESSGQDIRSLIPRWDKRRKDKSSLNVDLIEIIDKVIDENYAVTERPSIVSMCSEVRNEIRRENKARLRFGQPSIPTPLQHDNNALYMQIYRRVAKRNPKELMARREGERAAEREFGSVGQGVVVERILQRVQIDHTRLDLFIVDDKDRLPIGRPTLTYCIDEKSSYPLGFEVGWEPPSYQAVAACLRHAILPKEYLKELYPEVKNEWDAWGLPEQLVVDNGKEFLSKSLEDACLQLGIELIYCPPACPWFKGAIERHFGMMNTELLHQIPGTTFSNIMERGDYNPAENAVMTLSAFMEALHVFLVDIYARDRSKKGFIPARVWEEGMSFPPAVPPNNGELAVLLGSFETRVIQRAGIQFENLFYMSPNLATLRTMLGSNEEVRIKVIRSDLSRIWVYDHKISQQYFEVPCTDQEYAAGLSLWKHLVIRRYARDVLHRVDYEALALAKATIQDIVDREYNLTKQTMTRAKAARFKSGGMTRRDTSEANLSPIALAPPSSVLLGGGATKDESKGNDQLNATEPAADPPAENPRGKKSPSRKSPVPGSPAMEKPQPSPTHEEDDLDLSDWGNVVSFRGRFR